MLSPPIPSHHCAACNKVNELDQKTEKISCRSCGFSILYKRRTAKRTSPMLYSSSFFSLTIQAVVVYEAR
jgi:DNA-directed RNA polymerase subunit RPC12/RpoP